MQEVVIVDGVRTPIGRAHRDKGWFRKVRPDDMMVTLIQALLKRNPKVDPKSIEVGQEMELTLATLYEDDENEYVVWKWKPVAA